MNPVITMMDGERVELSDENAERLRAIGVGIDWPDLPKALDAAGVEPDVDFTATDVLHVVMSLDLNSQADPERYQVYINAMAHAEMEAYPDGGDS